MRIDSLKSTECHFVAQRTTIKTEGEIPIWIKTQHLLDKGKARWERPGTFGWKSNRFLKWQKSQRFVRSVNRRVPRRFGDSSVLFVSVSQPRRWLKYFLSKTIDASLRQHPVWSRVNQSLSANAILRCQNVSGVTKGTVWMSVQPADFFSNASTVILHCRIFTRILHWSLILFFFIAKSMTQEERVLGCAVFCVFFFCCGWRGPACGGGAEPLAWHLLPSIIGRVFKYGDAGEAVDVCWDRFMVSRPCKYRCHFLFSIGLSALFCVSLGFRTTFSSFCSPRRLVLFCFRVDFLYFTLACSQKLALLHLCWGSNARFTQLCHSHFFFLLSLTPVTQLARPRLLKALKVTNTTV